MRHVVIFARAPRLGQVKTRLAADIGDVAAWRFYRATLVRLARRLAVERSWRTWLAVTPDRLVDKDGVWTANGLPRGLARLPQGGGDLGERMARAMARFGTEPVLIIGSDIPELGCRHIRGAFDALRRNDLVFGPSADGGYWLVGAAQGARVGGLFSDVRWSGPHALSDTRRNVRPGVRVGVLETLEDIDNGEDYAAWLASAATPRPRVP